MTIDPQPAAGTGESLERSLREACRIVIVNWNSGDCLRESVRSIPGEFEVVIVDNASHDASLADLRTGSVCVIRNQQNGGFAAAANQGAAGCSREFLLFLNPDVVFASEGSADGMLRLLREEPHAGAATGTMYSANSPSRAGRRSQNLIRRLPTLSTALSDILFLDEFRQLWMRRDAPAGRLSAPPHGERDSAPAKIEQAPGACLLIRRVIFEEMGGFDPSFYPAWFEDVDLCKRLRDRGWEIFYHAQSVFRHQGGYSVSQVGALEFNRVFYRNMARYFEKHHGWLPAAVIRMAAPVGNTVRRFLAKLKVESRRSQV